MVRLGDICAKASSSLKQSDLDGKSGKYPVFGAGGWIQNADFYEQDKPYVAVVKDGAGAGRVTYLPAFSSVIGTMQYILPKPGTDARYLAYALESLNLSRYSMGATIPHIYFKDYCAEKLPGYSEAEQQEISSVLAKVDGLLALRQRQLDKLDELVKARFVESFGDFKSNNMNWPTASFDDFAKIDAVMTTEYEKYADYPHIGIDSIEKGTGRLSGYRTVREDNIISGKYIFTPKHIIYSKIRPNLNKVALPDFYGLCSADAYPILPNPQNCNREFLVTVMRSNFFLNYILSFSSRTNMPKVNRKEISGFKMPLPPLELQERFAAFVRQIDQSKLSIRRGLDKLATLRAALMREYFAPDNS